MTITYIAEFFLSDKKRNILILFFDLTKVVIAVTRIEEKENYTEQKNK